MAKTRILLEQSEKPRIIRLVESPFDVTAEMMDKYDRIVIRAKVDVKDKASLGIINNRFNDLSDGEIKYEVKVGETKRGIAYIDCRRVA